MSKPLIVKVDASALKESSCMRRFYWNVYSGYTSKLQTNDVEFGSSFHEFVKVMRHNPGRFDLATQAALKRFSVPMEVKPEKSYLTPEYLLRVCLDFWQNYIEKDQFETVVDNGTPLVELGFCYPYYTSDDIEVQLCGTIDDICKHKHGTYALRDYKTTSVYKADAYLDGYRLSPQLMFYRMVLGYYAKTYPESIFAKIAKLDVACFIDAVFLKGKTQPAEFKRSEVFMFSADQMGEFELLVNKKVLALVDALRASIASGEIPIREGMINGACQTVYGHCKYFNVCKQLNMIHGQHMLNRYFIQRTYNPLAFGKEHEIPA